MGLKGTLVESELKQKHPFVCYIWQYMKCLSREGLRFKSRRGQKGKNFFPLDIGEHKITKPNHYTTGGGILPMGAAQNIEMSLCTSVSFLLPQCVGADEMSSFEQRRRLIYSFHKDKAKKFSIGHYQWSWIPLFKSTLFPEERKNYWTNAIKISQFSRCTVNTG